MITDRLRFNAVLKEFKAIHVTDNLVLMHYQNVNVDEVIQKLPIQTLKDQSGIDIQPRAIKGIQNKGSIELHSMLSFFLWNEEEFRKVMNILYDARISSTQSTTPTENTTQAPKKTELPPPTAPVTSGSSELTDQDNALLDQLLSQPPKSSTISASPSSPTAPAGNMEADLEKYLTNGKDLILVSIDIKKKFPQIPDGELKKMLDKICTANKWDYNKTDGFIRKKKAS